MVRMVSAKRVQSRQHRRSRILQAASDAFAQRGFNGVSTREIAEAAGVGDTLLFYYFKGKADLYLDAFRAQLERLQAAIEAATSSTPDVDERFRRYVSTYLEHFFENEPGFALLLQEYDTARLPPDVAEQIRAVGKALTRQPLVKILDDGVQFGRLRAIDVEMCSIAIIGILLQFIRLHAAYPNIQRADVVAHVIDYYYAGLRSEGTA